MNVMVDALCKCGELQFALQFVEHVAGRVAPDLLSYAPLLDALAGTGRFDACAGLVCDMVANGSDPGRSSPTPPADDDAAGIAPNGVVLASLACQARRHRRRPTIVWHAYEVVVAGKPQHDWDDLARAVLIQSLAQAPPAFARALVGDVLGRHFRRTQRTPGTGTRASLSGSRRRR